MQSANEVRTFKIYISYALPDKDYAAELKEFFVRNGLRVHCDLKSQRTPEDNTTRLWATKSIRTCDLFVLLLSNQSLTPLGRLMKPLAYDSAEALSFYRKRLLVFLDDEAPRGKPRGIYRNQPNTLSTIRCCVIEAWSA